MKKETLGSILYSGVDLQSFDVRTACIRYISQTKLAEEHADFILGSIKVYEDGQKEISHPIANEFLEKITTGFKDAVNIKKVLQLIVRNPKLIDEHKFNNAIHFNEKAVERLLHGATQAFCVDPTNLHCVYRIFCKDNHLSYNENYARSFKNYFAETCGMFIIFQKFYKRRKAGRDLMMFIDADGCELLLNEYRYGKINNGEMTAFRNQLSWYNRDLYRKFQDTLVSEFGEKFVVDETIIDYEKIWRDNKIKNQQVLLNKGAFFEEAQRYAQAIGKEKFTRDDLWTHNNAALIYFQRSLIAETFSRILRDTPKTIDEVIGYLDDDNKWNWFKIQEIKELLSQRGQDETVDQELISFAEDWCRKKISELDYENAVSQVDNRNWTINSLVLFNNELYGLLNIDVDDRFLLKMLISDYTGGMNKGEMGLSGSIIKRVRDKNILKLSVLANVKRHDLPMVVLKTQFAICHYLNYSECLPALYEIVTNNIRASDDDKVQFTRLYLELGGSINDFLSFLPRKLPAEGPSMSWIWFLIEKMTDDYFQELEEPLLGVLVDGDQPDGNKMYCCTLLIRLDKLEGLKYWRDSILTNSKLPFDDYRGVLLQHCPKMPIQETVEVLAEVLEFTYLNNLHNTIRFPDSIDDAVYRILYAVAICSLENCKVVVAALNNLMDKPHNKPFISLMSFHKERIPKFK